MKYRRLLFRSSPFVAMGCCIVLVLHASFWVSLASPPDDEPLQLTVVNLKDGDELTQESTFDCKLKIEANGDAQVPKKYRITLVRTENGKKIQAGVYEGETEHEQGSVYTCSVKMKIPAKPAPYTMSVDAIAIRSLTKTKEEKVGITRKFTVVKKTP